MARDNPKWLAFYGMLQVDAHIVDRVGQRMERETGLPPAWYEVLAQIHKGPCRMGELAESLVLSRGGATRLIARMEEDGLVEREIPKEDRRATYARITDKGAEAFDRATPVHVAAVEELFSQYITDEEADVLRAVYARVLLRNGIDCAPVTEGYELEAQQVDFGARRERPGAVRGDREPVALAQRAGHVRALALGRPGHEHAVRVRDELGDQERGAVVGRAGGLAEPALHEPRLDVRPRRAASAGRGGRTSPCRRSPTAGCPAGRTRASCRGGRTTAACRA